MGFPFSYQGDVELECSSADPRAVSRFLRSVMLQLVVSGTRKEDITRDADAGRLNFTLPAFGRSTTTNNMLSQYTAGEVRIDHQPGQQRVVTHFSLRLTAVWWILSVAILFVFFAVSAFFAAWS